MRDLKTILILDCSMNGCVAAIYDLVSGASHEDVFETSRGQAEKLVPMVQGILDNAGIGFGMIDAIIVTVGPGTFTGIRIGLSAAKAFGLALDIPVYGISTLQALALGYVREFGSSVNVILETKRSDFYVQRFNGDGTAAGEASSLSPENIDLSGVFIGDALERFTSSVSGSDIEVDAGFTVINAEVIGSVFADPLKRGIFFSEDVKPIYLRAPDVSQPKSLPREIAK